MSFCTEPESACLDNYVIHTITGLVKRWLRELPDPLMTYDLYTDFLHAAGEIILYIFFYFTKSKKVSKCSFNNGGIILFFIFTRFGTLIWFVSQSCLTEQKK